MAPLSLCFFFLCFRSITFSVIEKSCRRTTYNRTCGHTFCYNGACTNDCHFTDFNTGENKTACTNVGFFVENNKLVGNLTLAWSWAVSYDGNVEGNGCTIFNYDVLWPYIIHYTKAADENIFADFHTTHSVENFSQTAVDVGDT